MKITALKCPSCGADINLDSSREYGYCSYCGCQIQIGDRTNIHVTHEFKGDAPHINVTNQYYYADDRDEDKKTQPGIVVDKPSGKKFGWGIALGIIGIIGLFSSGGKEASYIVICLLFIAVAVLLIISYTRAMKLYRDAVQNAVYSDTEKREKKR